MNPSEKDPISLDEKIALIRKKNEMIIKRQQLIEKEIELAKKHNAMVDVCAPKTFDDDKPTLYSDTIPKSHREERKRSVPDKVNYKPRNNNTKEDAAWRAERNEIDKERILRQRADSGWRREWDADKHVPDDKFLKDNFDRRGHSQEKSHTRSSPNQSGSLERSELPLSTRLSQYKRQQSDVSVERSELPVSTRQNQFKNKHSDVSVGQSEFPMSIRQDQCKSKGNDVSVERSEFPVSTCQDQYKSKQSDISMEQSEIPVPRRSKGRGRPVVSGDNPKITQNLRRTVSVDPRDQVKAPLKKRVSWGSEKELLESRRISLTDDRLKNITVKVKTADSNARKRSIEITEEQGPLIINEQTFKFDEKTSFSIKDCVAKASSQKTSVNRRAIEDAAPLPKPRECSSTKLEPKPIMIKRKLPTEPESPVLSHVVVVEQPSEGEVGADDDEEWEDVSDEDWESTSDNE